MKKYYFIIIILLVSFNYSCKDELDVRDTNEPTLATLNTESGIKQAALGVYGYFLTADGQYQEGGLTSQNFSFFALMNHSIIGDELFVPWGNQGWRWINRPASITLDNDSVAHPPSGGNQAEEIERNNSMVKGVDNPLKHEWYSMYVVNNMVNLVLNKLNSNEVEFSGSADIRKNSLLAWVYFWKGYVYSRIGSFYSAGLVTDEYDVTNSNFLSHDQMVSEANTDFDKAIALLQGLTNDADYQSVLTSIIPSYYCASIPTPEEWIRNINTLKARNILVNKKAKTMTTAEWQNVLDLSNIGLQSADFNFVMVPDPRIITWSCLPYGVTPLNGGWGFVSERLIQDFKDTLLDARFHRYIAPSNPPFINPLGRGIQFSTRFEFIDGTDIASSTQGTTFAKPFIYVGGSYEENELMKAEANIYLGNIAAGLASVDAVRDFQTSGLSHVSGVILNADSAKEELRKERRIGLMLRGLAFYDARRWGVIDPVADGGGRKDCWVLDPDGNFHTGTFDYQYLNYYPVPQNETDLNTPASGSASISKK